MVRAACCRREGVKKGAWTIQEDKLLSDYILAHGLGRWRNLPRDAGLNRCPKSCRLRWLNYLRPDIKRGNITEEEEDLIIRLHNLLGNRWSLIAGRLPGRTDNEIKNYWNTCLRKKYLGDFSKNHRGKPADEECQTQKFASSIVRTKAVRCTRLLFKNEDATTTNNSLSSSNPSSQVGSGLHPSLYSKVVAPEPGQLDIDGSFVYYDTQNFPPSDRENIFMMGTGSSRSSIFTDPLGESWYDLRGIDHVEEEILQYLTEDSMLQDVISRH